MMKIIVKKVRIVLIFLSLYFIHTRALFCYSCDESINEETRCNEHRPIECTSLKQKCVTSSSGRRLLKTCTHSCSSGGRGDSDSGRLCSPCDSDLCNIPFSAATSQAKVAIHNLTLLPYHFTLIWQPSTFWEASLSCRNKGKSLATIHNGDMQLFLETNLLSNLSPASDDGVARGVWIGAKRVEDDAWIWKDEGIFIPKEDVATKCKNKVPKYENWADNEPLKTSLYREMCGLINLTSLEAATRGAWMSQSCGTRAAGFLCQSNDEITGFVESTVYQSHVFTYHGVPVNFSIASNICVMSGGWLADLNDEQTKNTISSSLNFAINSKPFWSKQACEDSKPSTLPCSSLLPFICQTTFIKTACQNAPEGLLKPTTASQSVTMSPKVIITTSLLTATPKTTSSMTTTRARKNEPLPPYAPVETTLQDVTTAVPSSSDPPRSHTTNEGIIFCTSRTFVQSGKTYKFLKTRYQTYAKSIEICESGQAMASIFCGRNSNSIQFDTSTLATTSCQETLDTIRSEVSKMKFGSKSTSQLSSLTAQVRLLTSQPNIITESNLTSAIDILRSIDAVTYKEQDTMNVPPPVTSLMLNDIVTTASSLQSSSVMLSGKNVTERTELVSLVERFVGRISLNRNQTTYKFTTNHIKVEATELYAEGIFNETNDVIFKDKRPGDDLASPYAIISIETIRNILEDQTKRNVLNESTSIRAVFVAYTDDTLFPSSQKDVGKVITATLLTTNEEKISAPLAFSFPSRDFSNTNSCYVEKCSFYDPIRKLWTTDGCKALSENDSIYDTVHCFCNHMTSFAVVVSYEDNVEHVALETVSEVGLILCCICLLITVILFFALPELRRVQSADIHINLCATLFLAYMGFLIGIEPTNNSRSLCVATAATIHYFLLAAWGWMLVESTTMYRMFVSYLGRHKVVKAWKVGIIVYTAAALIVMATMLASWVAQREKLEKKEKDCNQEDEWSAYVGDTYCWITGPSLYFGFLAIIGIILSLNVIMSFLVIRAITWGRTKINSSIDEPPMVQVLRAVLVAVLMGVTWIFAVPVVLSKNEMVRLIFAWLFAIFTSVQGIFMFYFFCIRRSNVRRAWMNCMLQAICACKYAKNRSKEETTERTGRRSTSTTCSNEATWWQIRWKKFRTEQLKRKVSKENKNSSIVTEMTVRSST